jgi:hypothetical protein
MIFAMIVGGEDHGFDLLVWVELRGFEPLTPSMRTVGAAGSYMCLSVPRSRLGRRSVPEASTASTRRPLRQHSQSLMPHLLLADRRNEAF